VTVGDKVTMLFEDRETVRYQIQEMARVERIREPDKLEHEIETYGDLVPASDELSATLFIEIPELTQVKPELDSLVGIDESVFIAIGEGEEEERVRGLFDERQLEEDRISAVHYVRFPFTAAQREHFVSAASLRVRIDHANYRAEAKIGAATRASLLRDLRGETPLLLDLAAAPTEEAPEILLETGGVRAYRLNRRIAAEHLIVEPLETSTSLLDVAPDLLAELMAVVQRFAREVTARAGSCRVTTRVVPEGSETGARLQWHVVGDQR
jgi:diadenosine tetraphosphate (Ap4A) HIT family hydrolase